MTDPSKATVPDAKVAAVGTNFRCETATNGAGEYTWRISRPDADLHVEDALAVDFEMAAGSVSDSLTVQAGAPLLNTSEATVSTLVDQTCVENLPLSGRNFTFLAPVSAGVIQGQQEMRGLGASGTFAANGLRPAQVGKVSAP